MKFSQVEADVFTVFASQQWKDEAVATYPSNFVSLDAKEEFIRVSVLPSGAGINRSSVSGALIVSIFTPAGKGLKRANAIADVLETYLSGLYVTHESGSATQISEGGALVHKGLDRDNQALHVSQYTIPFNFFGAS